MKISFDKHRTTASELAFNKNELVILVEGKDDEEFYNRYFEKINNSNKKVKFQICNGIRGVIKTSLDPELKKYYAIIDMDSIKYNIKNIQNYSEQYRKSNFLITPCHCLESLFFTPNCIEQTFKLIIPVKHFQVFSKLFEEAMQHYKEPKHYTIHKDKYYVRKSVHNFRVYNNGSLECTTTDNKNDHYDDIPDKPHDINGKQLIHFLVCVQRYIEKHKRASKERIMDKILENINLYRISELDNFFSEIVDKA